MEEKNFLSDVKKITVETDEENPTVIAVITAEAKNDEYTNIKDGYRVRFSFKED